MEIVNRDILTVESGIIGHQVNKIPAMGAGLAFQIALKWPHVLADYTRGYNLHPCIISRVSNDLRIAHLVGQVSVGSDRRHTHYGMLAKAFTHLHVYSIFGRVKTYLPYGIGCGLGGGDWAVVSELIDVIIPHAIVCRL